MHYLFIFCMRILSAWVNRVFYSNVDLTRADRAAQFSVGVGLPFPYYRWWLVGWGVLLRTEWSLCLYAPSLCI
jgi:hypothetical protein